MIVLKQNYSESILLTSEKLGPDWIPVLVWQRKLFLHSIFLFCHQLTQDDQHSWVISMFFLFPTIYFLPNILLTHSDSFWWNEKRRKCLTVKGYFIIRFISLQQVCSEEADFSYFVVIFSYFVVITTKRFFCFFSISSYCLIFHFLCKQKITLHI